MAREATLLASRAAMSLTVVGSIAFDAVETPLGNARPPARRRRRALRARLLVPRRDARRRARSATTSATPSTRCCAARGVITDDIEHVAGRQDVLLGRRLRARRQHPPHAADRPQRLRALRAEALAGSRRTATSLFLANIQPDLQRDVREQCADARFIGAGLDEPVDRHRARRRCVRTIAMVDCLILNDGELQQLTDEPNHRPRRPRAAGAGPARRRRQAGRVRRRDVHADGFFGLPAYPDRRRGRPDRRRRHVRRRLHGLRRRARRRGARPTSCCAARWPTAPRSPPSTSRRSAPSAWQRLTGERDRRARRRAAAA